MPSSPSARRPEPGLSNYTITYDNGNLTVDAAPLTITANDGTKTYGSTKSFLGIEFTTSTLYNDDSVTSVTLTSTGAAATATVAGSTYAITPSAATGSGLANYTITYTNGNLTVTPAALTITASDASKVYGVTKTFAGTEFTDSGLLNSDTVTGVTLASSGAAATATVAGSTYAAYTPCAARRWGPGLEQLHHHLRPTATSPSTPLRSPSPPTTRPRPTASTKSFLGTEFTDLHRSTTTTRSPASLSPAAAPLLRPTWPAHPISSPPARRWGPD